MTNLDQFTIVGLPDAPRHPMWTKMFQRAGLDPDQARSRFQPIYQGLTHIHSPVIALGEQALRYMTGQTDLFRHRGRQLESASRLVYATMDPRDLLPRYSQQGDDEDDEGSGLNHAPARFQGVWVWDVQNALRHADVRRPAQNMGHYAVDPSRLQWEWWVDHLLDNGAISTDIETAYKMSKMNDEEWETQGLQHGQLLRISFCAVPEYSVSVSWTAEFLPGIRKLLASKNDKIWWNGAAFDVPRLITEGEEVCGKLLDYQDAWHIVESDQPKGLEWVTSYFTNFMAWKHLNGSNPGIYSCIDADGARQNALGIDKELAKYNQTHLFDRHVTQLMPILARAGQRGCKIDLDYSHALEDEMIVFRDQLVKDIQPIVPEELKPRKRYKRMPEEVAAKLAQYPGHTPDAVECADGRLFEPVSEDAEIKVCSHCHAPVTQWSLHMKGRAKAPKNDPNNFNPCKAAKATCVKIPGTVVEWDEILPWNPGSADQLKDYIRYYKHPMGKNRQTDADSASGKHLEKLVKKYAKTHPLYKLVSEYKKVAKTISTYVYHNYADANGYIHSTYKNGPSTWRLAASDVNLTNVGKRKQNPWARKARRQIVARPGHVFVGADSTSIEAVIVGYLIEDFAMITMAGKSIHAWLACQELGWEFNPTTMNRVKDEYKDLYNKMKTAIYLLFYGGDPYLIHMEDPDNFPTLASAKAIRDRIFAMIPKLPEWHTRTRERAKREGVLTSLWGYRHSFYDVYTFKRDKKGQIQYSDPGVPMIKIGKDGKRALAFEPQNCAAGFGRDTLLMIGQAMNQQTALITESKWAQYMPANCFCHDAYVLEVPEALAEEAEQFLVDVLTRPVPELGGLRIGCESEKGYNWAEVDPKHELWADGNPDGMQVIRKVEC